MGNYCCDCCSRLLSWFSGNNTQSSSSAQPPPNNNASPAVATEETPNLRPEDRETPSAVEEAFSAKAEALDLRHVTANLTRQEDPQTPSAVEENPNLKWKDPKTPPSSLPLPASTSHDASSFAESAPYAPTHNEQRPHEAPASVDPSSIPPMVSGLTKKINEDAASAADGENDINLVGLIEDISQLLKIIKTKSSDKRPSTYHHWPRSQIFYKLREILSEATDGASAFKGTSSSQHCSELAMKVVQNLLTELGQAHWAAASLLVVANILERFEAVRANRDECLSLLEEMSSLAQHVKDLKERPSLKKGMEVSIKKATESIVEGALMCCTQIDSSKFSGFFKASVNKNELAKFQKRLQKMYRHMNNQMFISILDAVECTNVRPQLKERERSYPEYAVGIDEQLEEVIELLEWESDKNVLAVMIHGLGGMGKTTLADAVFARLYIEGCKYSMVTLFDDVNSNPNIIEVQKCILKDLMAGRRKEEKSVQLESIRSFQEDQQSVIENIRTIEEGRQKIGRLLEDEIAFVYIDNVLEKDPLENLLPRNMEKAKKCRLLITTRDKEVRKGCLMDAVKYCDMKYLPDREALNLLKKELNYGKTIDTEQLNPDQLHKIVKLCGGIPKLVNVLARFVRFEEVGQQRAFSILMEESESWKFQIGDIGGYLFAYDRLPENVKDPFLDVCSFFNGWDWNEVTNIVGESNVNVLEKRALVNKQITITVHDVILAIGQQKTEGTRFIFKSASEIEQFLKKDIQGIKGISFNGIYDVDGESESSNDGVPFHISAKKLDSMSDSLRILALGKFAKVEGTCMRIFEKLVFFQGNVPHLPFNVSQSKKLTYLKYQPRNLNLLKEMPSNLKHMELDGRLHSNDAFEIYSSDLQQCQSLRTLRLLNFEGLKNLPEKWGNLSNCLQELNLSNCKSLEKLPKSISKLQSLRKLRMYKCSSLKQLPEDIGSLSSLQILDLEFCKSIEALPRSISELQSLRELIMHGCSSLKRFPIGFGSLSSLQELDLRSCSSIDELPETISKLQSLRELDMYKCLSLKQLATDFGSLSSLQALDLSYCELLEELPGSISKLQSLREFRMFKCLRLKQLPEDFGSLSSLQKLNLSFCQLMEELPRSISKLQSLKELSMSFCRSLKQLPNDFGSLSSLQELEIDFCQSIKDLPGSISKLQSLRKMDMSGSSLKRLPEDFGSLSFLLKLDLHCSKFIEELPTSISKLQLLEELIMYECSSLKQLPEDFGFLSSLQKLDLSSCTSIKELPESVSKLQSLKALKINGCSSLKRLPEDFNAVKSLESLVYSECPSLDPLSMQMLLEMSSAIMEKLIEHVKVAPKVTTSVSSGDQTMES